MNCTRKAQLGCFLHQPRHPSLMDDKGMNNKTLKIMSFCLYFHKTIVHKHFENREKSRNI